MIEPITFTAAAAGIRAGTLQSVDLLQQCLERICKYDDRVRAWAVVDELAARMDDRRHRRHTRMIKRWYNRAQAMYEEHGGRYSYHHCMLATKGKR